MKKLVANLSLISVMGIYKYLRSLFSLMVLSSLLVGCAAPSITEVVSPESLSSSSEAKEQGLYTLKELQDSYSSEDYVCVCASNFLDNDVDKTNKTKSSVTINLKDQQIDSMRCEITHYYSATNSNMCATSMTRTKGSDKLDCTYYLDCNEEVIYHTQEETSDVNFPDTTYTKAQNYIADMTIAFQELKAENIVDTTYEQDNIDVGEDGKEQKKLYDIVRFDTQYDQWYLYVDPDTKQIDIIMRFTRDEKYDTVGLELMTFEGTVKDDVAYTEIESDNKDLIQLFQKEICTRILSYQFEGLITKDSYNSLVNEIINE